MFAPQGFSHCFERPGDRAPLDVPVVFDTGSAEPDGDIGVVGALGWLPRDVLAASVGLPPSAFDRVPTELKPVGITRRARPGASRHQSEVDSPPVQASAPERRPGRMRCAARREVRES